MKKITVYHICMIAMAVGLNVVGGQIALFLRLPIYLDSIGTFFIASICGPVYGMIPSVISALIGGILDDVYAIYYAPVGILLGLVTGFVYKKKRDSLGWLFLAALLITIPTTLVSACITAYLFGGITSSGSTYLIQILAKTPLGLTLSCFLIQLCTDYLDRLFGLGVVRVLTKRLPSSILDKLK